MCHSIWKYILSVAAEVTNLIIMLSYFYSRLCGQMFSFGFGLNGAQQIQFKDKWQGPALVARSGGSKNVTYRQQTT